MIITVSTEHIAKGEPNSGGDSCAVALALEEHFPRRSIWVERCYIEVGRKSYPMPVRVTRFVNRFDKGKPCKPMRFRLRAYRASDFQ